MSVYDDLLSVVVQHLIDRWMDPETGIVAFGIFHPMHPPVVATSQWMGGGKWIHAERNALSRYQRRYGDPGLDAVIVVTLSPCLRLVSESRAGTSCGKLLVDHQLLRVHAGVLDEYQVVNGADDYEQLGINITFAEDEKLRATCDNLKQMFLVYGNEINVSLPKIKSKVGYSPFQ